MKENVCYNEICSYLILNICGIIPDGFEMIPTEHRKRYSVTNLSLQLEENVGENNLRHPFRNLRNRITLQISVKATTGRYSRGANFTLTATFIGNN